MRLTSIKKQNDISSLRGAFLLGSIFNGEQPHNAGEKTISPSSTVGHPGV